jgi:hypothetical protein
MCSIFFLYHKTAFYYKKGERTCLQTERQYRSDPEKVAMDTSVSEENYMFPTADRTAVTVVVAEM